MGLFKSKLWGNDASDDTAAINNEQTKTQQEAAASKSSAQCFTPSAQTLQQLCRNKYSALDKVTQINILIIYTYESFIQDIKDRLQEEIQRRMDTNQLHIPVHIDIHGVGQNSNSASLPTIEQLCKYQAILFDSAR